MKKNEFDISSSVGGISNTPPTHKEIGFFNERLLNDDLTATFDWYQVVFSHFDYKDTEIDFKSSLSINTLISIIGASNQYFEYDRTYGRFGYHHKITIDEGIEIHFCGPKDSNNKITTLLIISGRGCRTINRIDAWYNLFTYCMQHDADIKRLDLAIDDYSGKYYKITDLYYDVTQNNYVSIFKKRPDIRMIGNINDYESLSITFGSRSSGHMICVYDKNCEQYNKDNKFQKRSNYWVRWEIRFNEDAKNIIQRYLLLKNGQMKESEFYTFVSSILYDLLKIKVRNDENTNKSMWDDNPNYLKFLGDIEKIDKITKDYERSTLSTKIDWLNRSAMKALASVYFVYGEENFLWWLKKEICLALQRFKDEDNKIIVNHLLRQDIEDEELFGNHSDGVISHDDIINKELYVRREIRTLILNLKNEIEVKK